MLSRYTHVRMEANRRALDETGARQGAADERRNADAEQREQAAVVFSPRPSTLPLPPFELPINTRMTLSNLVHAPVFLPRAYCMRSSQTWAAARSWPRIAWL